MVVVLGGNSDFHCRSSAFAPVGAAQFHASPADHGTDSGNLRGGVVAQWRGGVGIRYSILRAASGTFWGARCENNRIHACVAGRGVVRYWLMDCSARHGRNPKTLLG